MSALPPLVGIVVSDVVTGFGIGSESVPIPQPTDDELARLADDGCPNCDDNV
jgi:hypothetical protein